MSSRFAPVDIRVDTSVLPDNERQALVRIIQAAQILDGLFLRQVSARNESRLLLLLNDTSPLGKARLAYFLVNKGPWSALDDNAPFVPGVEPKPPQANFYPADATRAEVDAWMNALPKAEEDAATGFFTAIRRNPGWQARGRALLAGISGRAHGNGALAPRSRRPLQAAELEVVPGEARSRLHQQRLLRK